MTDINIHRSIYRLAASIVYLCCFASIMLSLAGCGGGGSDPVNNKNTVVGDLDVKLAWQTTGADASQQPAPANLDACEDFQITGIYIRVKDAAGNIINKSEKIPCSDRSAQVGNLKAQSGCTVEVEGYVGEQKLWFGSQGEVSIGPEPRAEPILIEMTYIGVHTTPPSATISPVHATTNVPTDTAISVRFARAVIPSSVNTDSIQVKNAASGEQVPGTIAYNAETFEVLFSPAEALAVSTSYTITVTTDVLDSNGQRIPEPLTSQFSTPAVWLVDPASDASGPGKSWGEAFHTIAEAVAAAGNDDQIWVKQGTYELASQVVFGKSVELLGGFEGTETQRNQRDPSARETVVSASSENRCFYLEGDATIDGFTFTEGSQGGQLRTSGGAIYVNLASPRITNCRFVNNTVVQSLIRIGNGGAATISGCTFKENKVVGPSEHSGKGLIDNYRANSTTIHGCRFIDNSIEVSGGLIRNILSDNITISGCRFTRNNGTDKGGAIYNSGSVEVNVLNSIFNETFVHGTSGGAIVNDSKSSLSIKNCTIVYNTVSSGSDAQARGGALSNLRESTVDITNSIIWGNRSVSTGMSFFLGEMHSDSSSSTNITYSNIRGYIGFSSNVIREDPRFGPEFHLQHDSPCINKGDSSAAPAQDIDGEARPQGGVDLGADEFTDGDGDHMPDYWEVSQNVSSADNDEDGDQLTNLDEYHLGTDPHKAQGVSDAIHKGRIRNDGVRQASDSRILIGVVDANRYRSFIAFDVSDISSVKAAILRLELVLYNSDKVLEDIHAKAADATLSELSTDLNGEPGEDIYNGLGTGTDYGKREVSPAAENTVVNIPLNQAALEAIRLASQGTGHFIIGLSSTSIDSHLAFSEADEIRTHQLVLVQE